MPSKLAVCLRLAALCLCCALPLARADMTLPTSVDAALKAAARPAEEGAEGAEPLPRHGALYRVRRDGQTSYLFGTIHVGKQTYYPLEPEVSRALADATSLVIELDIRANDAFQLALGKHGSYANGDTIERHLSPATLRQLVQQLARAGMSLQSVQHYKPWLVGNVLLGLELERNGFQRSHAVEYFLLDAAQHQDKTVRELESADYQLALFDTLDEAQQEQYLRENLADLESGAALRRSRDLIEAWNGADGPRIDAALHEFTGGNSVNAVFMQTMLLGKRNPEMATAIERIMRQDKVAFVGVGLLHLAGKYGLPQLLRQRGYQIEQLY